MANTTNIDTQKNVFHTNEIIVCQLNTNSIRSIDKRHQLEIFLKENKPHILLGSETNLSSECKIQIKKYNIHRADRINKDGGGTAIFANENLHLEKIKIPTEISELECCAVKLKLIDNSNIIFISIYRPPKKDIKHSEMTALIKMCNNTKFVIAGDFNAHSTLWNSHKTCKNGKILENWYNDYKNTYKF